MSHPSSTQENFIPKAGIKRTIVKIRRIKIKKFFENLAILS